MPLPGPELGQWVASIVAEPTTLAPNREDRAEAARERAQSCALRNRRAAAVSRMLFPVCALEPKADSDDVASAV